MSKLETRLSRLEKKLKLKPKIYTVVDWSQGDGKAEKEIAEIKKADPDAKLKYSKSSGFKVCVSRMAVRFPLIQKLKCRMVVLKTAL